MHAEILAILPYEIVELVPAVPIFKLKEAKSFLADGGRMIGVLWGRMRKDAATLPEGLQSVSPNDGVATFLPLSVEMDHEVISKINTHVVIEPPCESTDPSLQDASRYKGHDFSPVAVERLSC